jgi:hypothetical protein
MRRFPDGGRTLANSASCHHGCFSSESEAGGRPSVFLTAGTVRPVSQP